MRMAVNGPFQSVSGEAIGWDYRAFVTWKLLCPRFEFGISPHTKQEYKPPRWDVA